MSLFHKNKNPDDVQQYVSAGSAARKNWTKYKETGKDKFKEKAKRGYDTQKALRMKMLNPGTRIENNNLEIKDSFNKSKSTKISVPVKVSVKAKTKKSKK